jgi:tetratricopeptide (TPR) repeat protein
MYQLREQWSDAAWAARRLLIWQPKDQNTRAQLIESELRAGRTQVALADTAAGLAVANEHEIERLLEPWVIQKSESRAADTVANIARGASGQRRIAMARFLTLAHHPPEVLELMRVAATLPVKVPNATQNALYGAALAQTGQTAAAFERLDQVISLDSANADALRARAELRSRLGHHKAAIEDAQKLVASDRKSSSARLLMAQIQVAAGDPDGARRTLWDAFHDIPADRSIYGQLRRLVARLEGGQSVERLAQEFNDQRTEEITRGFA